jgi:O-antigen/teichoic acid export membrane protein
MSSRAATTAGKILHNSIWFGLETVIETVVFLSASVAVARYLGPQKLGYFSYINFFVMIVTRTSGSGLAGATRKYMAEFIALDQLGAARAVYNLAYRYQLLGAALITVLGLASVAIFGDPSYRLMSYLLILSIVPGVMSWVPAQANNAFEDVSKNTLSAFGYLITYAIVITLTIHFHWDLVGVASAALVSRTVEVVLRTIPLNAKLRKLPLEKLDGGVIDRIRKFCLQAIGIQLLMSVVWDRSEMVFLRAFSSLEQIAFYSISFSLAANLLIVPRTFGTATGISLMVEAARDPERIDSIVKNSCRYLLLVVFPVHLGAAAITSQAIRFVYGAKYTGAIPVLIVASILSIPRAFQEIPDILLRAADRQKQLFLWLTITGIVNILLDAALIPHFGAVGAAWGNGLAQAFGIVAIWKQAQRAYRFSLPTQSAIRLGLAGLLMAGIAYGVGRLIPGIPGLIAAVVSAVPIYLGLIKLVRGLEPSDRLRLAPLVNRFPGPVRPGFSALIAFATPAAEEIDMM